MYKLLCLMYYLNLCCTKMFIKILKIKEKSETSQNRIDKIKIEL